MRRAMNKSSTQEKLSELVQNAAGLFEEAKYMLEQKKIERKNELESLDSRLRSLDEKYQELNGKIADYGERKLTSLLNKAKSELKDLDKEISGILVKIESKRNHNFDLQDKEEVFSNLLKGHQQTLILPLLKGEQVILDDSRMAELVRLSEDHVGANAEKAEFVRFLVIAAAEKSLVNRLETRNQLLQGYDNYQNENGGTNKEIFQSLGVINEHGEVNENAHGVIFVKGIDEYELAQKSVQKHQESLRDTAMKFGISDAKIAEDIDSSRFTRAADTLYSRLSVAKEVVNVGGEATRLMWADKLFQAIQSNEAKAILIPKLRENTEPSFSELLAVFNHDLVAGDFNEKTFRGCLIDHAIKLNEFLHRLEVPNSREYGAASLQGGNKQAIEQRNAVNIVSKVTEQLINKIGAIQQKNEPDAIILLNLLTKAYASASMDNPRAFFASTEIHGAIQQLVTSNSGVLDDKDFVDALLAFNKMAEHFEVNTLNLGAENNKKLDARLHALSAPKNHPNIIGFSGLAKEIGETFKFITLSEGADVFHANLFSWLLKNPDLMNPDEIYRGGKIPDVIAFKDGAMITRGQIDRKKDDETEDKKNSQSGEKSKGKNVEEKKDDLILSGFSPERMKSFNESVLAGKFSGTPEIASTDPKFHEQVAVEFSVAQPNVLKRRDSQLIQGRLSKKLKTQGVLGETPALKGRQGTVLGQTERKESRSVTMTEKKVEEKKQGTKGDKKVSFSESDDTKSSESIEGSSRSVNSDSSSEKVSSRNESAVRGVITPRGASTTEQKSDAGQSFLSKAWNAFLKYTNVGALITIAVEAWNKSSFSVRIGGSSEKTSTTNDEKNESKKEELGSAIRLPNTSMIAAAEPKTLFEAEKSIKESIEKYSIKEFPYEKARTEHAIRNMMSHVVFKESVNTDYDNTIIRMIMNQKNNDPRFNNTVVEAMALRNALAERERLPEKSPADQVAIELLRVRLNNKISNMEKLQGERVMTDTTRNDLRSETSTESISTLDHRGIGAKPGIVEESSLGSDSEAESSIESELLVGNENAQEKTSLLGRLRQAVAGLFGAGGKAEAKAGAAAAESGEAKYEYNQVRLNGVAQHFGETRMQKKLGAWIESQKAILGEPKGKLNTLPIEFAGGQRIEVSGKDVVMKGFSVNAYESFRKKMFQEPPSFSVSAPDRASYAAVAGAIQKENANKTLTSRFTSVSLFFQRAVHTMASFLGFVKDRPQRPALLKSIGTSAIMSELSHPETAPISRPSPQVEPSPARPQSLAQNSETHPPQSYTQLPQTPQSPFDHPAETARFERVSGTTGHPVIPQAMREKLAVTVIIQGHDMSAVEKSVHDVVADLNNAPHQVTLTTEHSEGLIKARIETQDNAIIEVSCNKASQQVELKVSPSTKIACDVVLALVEKLPEPGREKTVVVESQGEHGKALIESLKQQGHHVSLHRDDLKQQQIQSPRASTHD